MRLEYERGRGEVELKEGKRQLKGLERGKKEEGNKRSSITKASCGKD